MVSKELVDYIEECRKLGHSDSKIRNTLRKEGWSEPDVLEAMFKYAKPKKSSNKLFLVSLVLFGLLIAGIVGGVIFMLNDIERTSAEIADLTNNIRKSSQTNSFD
jgi:hypothetical protein